MGYDDPDWIQLAQRRISWPSEWLSHSQEKFKLGFTITKWRFKIRTCRTHLILWPFNLCTVFLPGTWPTMACECVFICGRVGRPRPCLEPQGGFLLPSCSPYSTVNIINFPTYFYTYFISIYIYFNTTDICMTLSSFTVITSSTFFLD
jgi:hypothetical protein